MRLRARRTLPLLLATLALVASGCASSRHQPADTVALHIGGAGGDHLDIALSSDTVRDAVEEALGSDLRCNSTLDPEVAALLTRLDQKPHATAEVRHDDGVLRGRRRGGRLELEVSDDDGGGVEIRMPWAVAECLLGRATSLDAALQKHHGSAVVEVRFEGKDGATLSASLR